MPHYRRAHMMDLVDLQMFGTFSEFFGYFPTAKPEPIDIVIEDRTNKIRVCRYRGVGGKSRVQYFFVGKTETVRFLKRTV